MLFVSLGYFVRVVFLFTSDSSILQNYRVLHFDIHRNYHLLALPLIPQASF